MAIKIGKYYITQNNPRELLRERAELINILDEIRGYIKENYVIDNPVKFKNDIWDILDKVKE